jgi:hypothetical protein
MGFSRRRAVLILYGFCLVLSVVALILTIVHGELVLLVIVFLVLMVYASLRVFGRVTFRDIVQKMSLDEEEKRRTMMALTATNRVIAQISRTRTLDELWQACLPMFEALELTSAAINLCPSLQMASSTDKEKNPSPPRTKCSWVWHRANGEIPATNSADSTASPSESEKESLTDRWEGRFALVLNDRYLGELYISRSGDRNPILPETSELISRLRQKMILEVVRLESSSRKN